jgi:predicted permease
MIWQDVRYVLRTMRQQPAFAATAILTLALAIGANTAMFTVIQAVLLKPLPYPDSNRLVTISGGATPVRFEELKAAAHSFSAVGAFAGQEEPTLSGGLEPEVIKGARVSANFLQILAVSPLLGRSFRAAEDSPGGAPVVMISFELWQRRFAGDADIAGKTAMLGGMAYTIIGVLPPRFAFPFAGLDVWLTVPLEWPLMAAKSRPLSPFLSLFGRLKPEVTLEQANAEAKVIHSQYAMAHPAMFDAKPAKPERVTPLKDGLVSDVRTMLWMLMCAVGFVLMVACANVASLLMARASSRLREIAIRSALGADRRRLMGQFIVESLVLSVAGGVLGVLLATWSLRAVPSMTILGLPRLQEIHIDWLVLGFAAMVSIATGMLFGLAPALSASRPDLIRELRLSGAAANRSVTRGVFSVLNVSGLLLVAQVALSIVLLIGTTLLMESVSRLRGVALGFTPTSVLTANISLAPAKYETPTKKALFFEQLLERVRSAPGVRNAAAAMFLPMMAFAGTPVQDAAKPPLKLNERLIATVSAVTPGYFATLDIPLRRGRDFTQRDKEDAQRVAIIDEALARRLWPMYPQGLDPIGQHIWVGMVNPHPTEIVGIAANVHQNIENTAWPQTVYVAYAQSPQSFASLAVKTRADPLSLSGAVREAVRQLDKDQAVSAVRSMDDLIDEEIGQRRLLMILLGSFAALALLLVLLGIYGLIAYSVTQRTQELGIRRALGAQPGNILRLVVGQSLGLAMAGVALGIVGALGLTRLMKSLLFHVSANDPLTYAVVAGLFLCVALVASYIPARRATRIDPVTALRV